MGKGAFTAFVLAGTLIVAFGVEPAQTQAGCARIKDGTILTSSGTPVTLGYDEFGYNYQARLFNGTYDSVDRKLDGMYWGQTGDYVDDNLIMKWSDDWLSNQDCNFDGKLDRGGTSGVSKGWETNQVEGDYIGDDGDSHHYTYFAKIVYDGGSACSIPANPLCLWGVYAIIEEVYNDPYGGYHGVDRSKLAHPAGFGYYANGQ